MKGGWSVYYKLLVWMEVEDDKTRKVEGKRYVYVFNN